MYEASHVGVNGLRDDLRRSQKCGEWGDMYIVYA